MGELKKEVTLENFNDIYMMRSDIFENYLWIVVLPDDKNKREAWKLEIDKIAQYPNIDKLRVTGLNQEAFEYLADNYGKQIKVLSMTHCQTIGDLSPVGMLSNLEFLHIYWNSKADQLWDTSKTQNLKGLYLCDFTKLHDLTGIDKCRNLKIFKFGNLIDRTATVNTYTCFADLNVEVLDFSGKKILDGDLSFLKDMPKLKEFDFPTNLFTTEEVAWIVANYPDLKGYALKSKIEFEKDKEVLIVGKRKPCLKIEGNEERIKKYDDNFDKLVEKYCGIRFTEISRK